ncbi:MAG TPA: hypothetical protein VFH68_16845 [Polyangia bacterium]|jgi:hypothetical protein|nr:hypothetical protein [Polyangia bacterium]
MLTRLTMSMIRGTAAPALVGLMVVLGLGACGSSNSGNSGAGGKTGGSGGGTPGSGGSAAGGATGNPGTGGMTGGPGTGGASAGTGGATGGTDAGADAPRADTGSNVDAPATADGAVSPQMSFFVTSETSATGNLGGLAAADAKCARLAAAAGVTGKTWKAYLSTAAENARTRIGSGPWFNIHGVMIAANLVQLHEENGMTNNITQNTALTDKGLIVPGRLVRPAGTNNEHDMLTGSLMNGMVNTGFTCGAWDSAVGNSYVGHVDRNGTQTNPIVMASWNSAHPSQCADTAPGGGAGRFYCFATN